MNRHARMTLTWWKRRPEEQHAILYYLLAFVRLSDVAKDELNREGQCILLPLASTTIFSWHHYLFVFILCLLGENLRHDS